MKNVRKHLVALLDHPTYGPWLYGGGIFLAFGIPWMFLPEGFFLRTIEFYMGAATLFLVVICCLGIWQEMRRSRGSKMTKNPLKRS
jgi:hypothetical protein